MDPAGEPVYEWEDRGYAVRSKWQFRLFRDGTLQSRCHRKGCSAWHVAGSFVEPPLPAQRELARLAIAGRIKKEGEP